jgi:putative protease
MTRGRMESRPEVLAPAGDRACLEAAVRAGADAVYFGLQGFNARARAANFDAAALGETLRFLHEHGRKGYVTLNTLVFDEELPALERAVRACADAGVDAVIVQDLGVAKLVRAVAPSLPVHASTQMTCTDAASVELAREIGASRVILARELSLEDIGAIRRASAVELEVFVHGALCISYSGQCLTSEAIGGRSANRGACAQACRLPYELVVDGELRPTGDRAYLLSPEDLEASALVPDLVRLGVSALKIEGRLKGPDYVAATTRLYRAAIDAAIGAGPAPSDQTRKHALQAYTRGSGPGFLAGIDHQRLVEGRACDHRGLLVGECLGNKPRRGRAWMHLALRDDLARGDGVLVEGGLASAGEIGGRVWGIARPGRDEELERARAGEEVLVWLGPERDLEPVVAGRRVFKTSDPAAERAVLAEIARSPRRAALDVRVSGAIGAPLEIRARTEHGAEARVESDAKVEPARTTPLDEATLREKIGRLGESPFFLRQLEIDLPPNVIVPVSALNRARRAVVDALIAAAQRRHAITQATSTDLLATAVPPRRNPPPGGLFVLCRTLEQAHAALDAGADGVYLDFLELTGTGNAVRELRARPSRPFVGLAPPRIRKPAEEKIDRYLDSLEPDALLVRGLGALEELSRRASTPLAVGDFSLNVTNRITAAEVLGRGLSAFTPSFDLDAAQLVALLSGPFAPWAEVVLHHPMPLFHMEHCAIAALLSTGKDHKTCGRPCERHHVSLRDRAGMAHPVEADVGCRNTVFHAKPQSALELVPRLRAAGAKRFRIELVREKREDVAFLVRTYRDVLESRTAPREAWTTLRTEAGYGVVKGSLRVLP